MFNTTFKIILFLFLFMPLLVKADFEASGYKMDGPLSYSVPIILDNSNRISRTTLPELITAVCDNYLSVAKPRKELAWGVLREPAVDSQTRLWNTDGGIFCHYTYEYNYNDCYNTGGICASISFSNSPNDTDHYGPLSPYIETCPIGVSSAIDYSAGTVSLIAQPEFPYTKCINSCTYNFDGQPENYDVGIDPLVADSYGCTYDQNGYISNCPSNTPVRLWVNYISDGQFCVSDSGNAAAPIQPPNDLDLSPVVNSVDQLNENLTGIFDPTTLPDVTPSNDANTTLQNYYSEIKQSPIVGAFDGVANLIVLSPPVCNAFTIDLTNIFSDWLLSTDITCTLWSQISPYISTIMLVVWTIIGFKIVTEA